MNRPAFSSDLSDREWGLLEPLLPPGVNGRPLQYPRREIVNGILPAVHVHAAVFQDRDGAPTRGPDGVRPSAATPGGGAQLRLSKDFQAL